MFSHSSVITKNTPNVVLLKKQKTFGRWKSMIEKILAKILYKHRVYKKNSPNSKFT